MVLAWRNLSISSLILLSFSMYVSLLAIYLRVDGNRSSLQNSELHFQEERFKLLSYSANKCFVVP